MTNRNRGTSQTEIDAEGSEELENAEGKGDAEFPDFRASIGKALAGGPQKGANLSRRKSVLGRGLSALLSSSAVPVDISNIPLAGVGGSAIAEPQSSEGEVVSSSIPSGSTEAPLQTKPTPAPLAEPKSKKETAYKAPSNKDLSSNEANPSETPAPRLSVVPDEEPLEGGLVYLSVDRLTANPGQPRKQFAEAELNELTDNIKRSGLLQPILVRRRKSEPGQLASYEIVAGERRFRAAKKAGLVKVPAILKQLSDKEALEIGIIENVQRANLNPVEEAQAYQRLMEEFGATQNEVAERVGKDRASVANLLRLLKLDPKVLNLISDGKLSAGHGRALLACAIQAQQHPLAERIIAEGLSVRAAEALAAGRELSSSPPAITGIPSPQAPVKPLMQIATEKFVKDKPKKSPSVLAIEERLRRVLGTKVLLAVDENGQGEMKISFFSLEELEGIVERFER